MIAKSVWDVHLVGEAHVSGLGSLFAARMARAFP